jgi:hypothetical protein
MYLKVKYLWSEKSNLYIEIGTYNARKLPKRGTNMQK